VGKFQLAWSARTRLARPVGMAALQAATKPYASINRQIKSAPKLTPLWRSFCWRVALSSSSIKKRAVKGPCAAITGVQQEEETRDTGFFIRAF